MGDNTGRPDGRATGNHVPVSWGLDFYCIPFYIHKVDTFIGGPGSLVGIATAYGLHGPGIESR